MNKNSKNAAAGTLEAKTSPTPSMATLIVRQRNLYAKAEAIERANDEGRPLSPDLSNWLSVALKNIACGKDAEVCLGVKNLEKGVRKDGLLKEMQQKCVNGFIAATTVADDPQAITNAEAFEQAAGIGLLASTVRKNWNQKDSNRDAIFNLTDP
jgi:hypothetical protein